VVVQFPILPQLGDRLLESETFVRDRKLFEIVQLLQDGGYPIRANIVLSRIIRVLGLTTEDYLLSTEPYEPAPSSSAP
jgi:hypothetical protein